MKRSRSNTKSPVGKDALAAALELQRSGRIQEAESALRQLLSVAPQHLPTLLALDSLLSQMGRAREAVRLLEGAASHAADNPTSLLALGRAHLAAQRRREAIALMRRAVAIQPEFVEGCFSLGVALQEQGDTEEALCWLERTVSLAPENAMMQFRFADALWAAGDSARSVGHYQAALSGMPQSVELLTDLARTLHARQLFDGAAAMSRRALRVDPRSLEAHVQLGQSLLGTERLGEALTSLRTALGLDPRHATAQLAFSYAAFRCGYVEEVVDTVRRCLLQAPEPTLHSNLVFACAFHPDLDAAAVLNEARSWARAYADPLDRHVPPHANDRDPERRLRVAYVAPDFWDHCQSLFMAPLLQAHDRSRYEVTCYASVERPDAITELLRQRADTWHDVKALDDLALAERIRSDGIDILVDLTMHMSGNRLRTFARRPAPVQICWLAYPGTTGLSQIDYRITDQYIDPPPAGEHRDPSTLPRVEDLPSYRERSIVLKDAFWCYEPLATHAVSDLPALAKGYITFGCLNNLAKVNDGVLELWARVLSAVPQSRMLLRAPAGAPRARAVAAFEKNGVDGSRMQFADKLPRRAYLASYAGIDICLDTFPYNGHTTSLDAHWMGVPVVTLVGQTVVGRAGLCQATHLGLADLLVASSPEQFVERAAALASNFDRLSALRGSLRQRLENSPLMDAAGFARQLEAAYRTAWKIWCERGAPVSTVDQ